MSELDGVFYKEIVEQGLREFPNECCGVIAAADGVPVKVFAMTNADASPVTYRLDGKEQLRVFDEMDDAGLGAVGDLPLAHALGGLPVRDRPAPGVLPGRALHAAVAGGPGGARVCGRSGSATARSTEEELTIT